MSGKGDTPRPLSVERKVFEAEYERIFGIPVHVDQVAKYCDKCGRPMMFVSDGIVNVKQYAFCLCEHDDAFRKLAEL